VLQEIIDQIGSFSGEDKEADYQMIAENMRHYGVYPKLCVRFWELARKKFLETSKSKSKYFIFQRKATS
jgi:hypothetical protein